jgi:hypothetical protein
VDECKPLLLGMQLVDTVFLTLPVATLQAYIGMACSSPDVICPGRSGFDIIVGWLAVVGLDPDKGR